MQWKKWYYFSIKLHLQTCLNPLFYVICNTLIFNLQEDHISINHLLVLMAFVYIWVFILYGDTNLSSSTP